MQDDDFILTPVHLATPDQQQALLHMRNADDVRQYMIHDRSISDDDHQAWLTGTGIRVDQHHYIAEHDGHMIGSVNIVNLNPLNRRADWGFFIDPELQGTGLGPRLLTYFLDFIFAEFNLYKVDAEVLGSNHRGQHTHEKLGFRKDGIKQGHIWRSGKAIDVHLYSLFAADWTQRQTQKRPAL